MSDLPEKPKVVSNKLVDLLVSEVFRKNGINTNKAKKKLSNEQKEMLRDLVTDLSQQVDTFVNQPNTKKTDAE